MASEYGYFWDSKGGDRLYSAASMEDWLRPFFVNGVFNGEMQVISTGGLGIEVAAGNAYINGKLRKFEDPTPLTITIPHSTLDRTDIVVVERNDAERIMYLKVVTGIPGEGAPEPSRTTSIYQLVLAQIEVKAGATQITQSNITDTRISSTLCGYVCATVDEIDFDQIVAQFNAWFDEYKEEIIEDFSDAGAIAQAIFQSWFENIKGQLDKDAAGHLQLEVDATQNIIAPSYMITSRYAIGDFEINDGVLYRCKRTWATPGPFNPAYWEVVQVTQLITELDNKIDHVRDGLENNTTVFNADGSITETRDDRVTTTVFNADGSITETVRTKNLQTVFATKTTVFNADGSITETIS